MKDFVMKDFVDRSRFFDFSTNCVSKSKKTYGQTRGINSSQKQFTCFYKMFSVSNTFLGLTLRN